MENTEKMMEGGYLEGNSHANGGIKIKTPEGQIEAEGGETIINKRSMESQDILICEGTPKEIASKVNEYGGGVEFAEGGNCKTVSMAEDGTQVESNMPKEDTTTFDNGGEVQEEISTKPETIETKEAKETTYTITSLYDSELSWQSSYKGIEDYIKVEGGQFDCQKDDTMAVCLRKLGLRMVANIEIPIYETDFDIHDDQTASRGTNLRSTDKDKRPSPSISATIFPVGHTMEGNDGNMWQINEDSRGIHRWGRVKAEDGLDITMDNEDISRLEKLKKEGKLKRYLDVRGNGKKVFETIIPNKSEKGMYKRYESTSQSSLGTLQNEYLDENDVLNWLKKTSPKYNKSSTVEGEGNFYNINGIIKTKSGIVLNVGDDVLLHNMYEVKVKSINTDTNSVIVKYPDGKELLWGTTNIYVKKYAKGSTIKGFSPFAREITYEELKKAEREDNGEKGWRSVEIDGQRVIRIQFTKKYKADGNTIDKGSADLGMYQSNFPYTINIRYMDMDDIPQNQKHTNWGESSFYFLLNTDYTIHSAYGGLTYGLTYKGLDSVFGIEIQFKDDRPKWFSPEEFAKEFIGKDEINKRAEVDNSLFKYAKVDVWQYPKGSTIKGRGVNPEYLLKLSNYQIVGDIIKTLNKDNTEELDLALTYYVDELYDRFDWENDVFEYQSENDQIGYEDLVDIIAIRTNKSKSKIKDIFNSNIAISKKYAKGSTIDTLRKSMANGGLVEYDIEYKDEEGDTYSTGTINNYEEAKAELKRLKQEGFEITQTWKWIDGEYKGEIKETGGNIEKKKFNNGGGVGDNEKEVWFVTNDSTGKVNSISGSYESAKNKRKYINGPSTIHRALVPIEKMETMGSHNIAKYEVENNEKYFNGGGVEKENADNVLLEMNESINNFEEKWLWYLKNDNLIVEFNLHYGWVDEEYYVGPEERMGEFLKALDYRYVALEDEDSNVVMVSKEKEKEIIKELDNIFKEYFENKDKDIEIDNVIYGERKYIYDGPIILENSKGIPEYEKGNTIKEEMTFNNSIGNAITRLTNYIATHENKIVINKSTYTIEKVTPNFIRVSGGQGATYNIVPYFPKNALNTPSPLLVPRSYYSLSRGSVKHTFAILEDGSLFDIAEEGIDVNINEPKMNSFKSTFTINNNYKGKRPFEIWDAWNEDQRKHFLKDHDIKNLDNSKIKEYTFDELPLSVKTTVRFHKNSGQYANGGIIGKRIKMIKMNDPYPVEPGTMGTVKFIDDNGQIHVNWDNGRTLAIIPRVDEYQIM